MKNKKNNEEKCLKIILSYAEIEGVFSKAINTINDTLIDTNVKKNNKKISVSFQ